MKRILASFLATLALAVNAFAHGDVELGPNGGRIIEFAGKPPLAAEVVLQGENFVIGLYDEATKKDVAAAAQTVTVTHKESGKKLDATLKEGKWSVAKPAGKDFWLIVSIKEDAKAKARVARLHYDETICSDCKVAEWVCKCAEMKKTKK